MPPSGGTGPLVSGELLRLHRNTLSPVLIIGGNSTARAVVALEFHRASPFRLGSLVALDCATQEDRLRAALEAWLVGAGAPKAPNPLWPAERGTLFLDSIGSLPLGTQQLLRLFTNRCSALSSGSTSGWISRLAVGSDEDLWDLVAGGRFLGNLADGLDKIRVEMDSLRQGGAA